MLSGTIERGHYPEMGQVEIIYEGLVRKRVKTTTYRKPFAGKPTLRIVIKTAT